MRIRPLQAADVSNIPACFGALGWPGKGPQQYQRRVDEITEVVVRLQDTSPGTLGAFMKWVTQSMKTASERSPSVTDTSCELVT